MQAAYAHAKLDVYTVIVRGEPFQLSKNQIEFDAPNYFTSCFCSGFSESVQLALTLDQNPVIFAIIVDYLSGYPILPLSPQCLSLGLSVDSATAHRYLLADAQFYGLSRLCELLTRPALSLDLQWTGYANEMVNLFEVAQGRLPGGAERRKDGSIVSARNGLPVLAHARGAVCTYVSLHNHTVQSV